MKDEVHTDDDGNKIENHMEYMKRMRNCKALTRQTHMALMKRMRTCQ